MNDGIDTLRENNEIAPFKNILNEMYSRDISKKVHASYYLKATKGDFTGCVAPFGYVKDPADKNHLLVDPETAPIVQQIFGYALDGRGPNYIRRRLEDIEVPCPTWWNRQRGIRNHFTKWELADPERGRFIWDFSVIKDMLMNPVYMGAIASQKRNYRFKLGTLGEKKPDESLFSLPLWSVTMPFQRPEIVTTGSTPSSISSAPKYSDSRIWPRRSSPVSCRSLSLGIIVLFSFQLIWSTPPRYPFLYRAAKNSHRVNSIFPRPLRYSLCLPINGENGVAAFVVSLDKSVRPSAIFG